MGALVSSSKRRDVGSSSPRRVSKRKRSQQRNAAARSASERTHRPVLQLQVKAETLEQVRKRAGTTGEVVMTRSTLRALAGADTAYENLFPRQQHCESSSLTASGNHTHHKQHFSTSSQDSMVLLQILEDQQTLLVSHPGKDDYDHLQPKEDYSHLCTCTYGPLGEKGEGQTWEQKEPRGAGDCDNDYTTLHYSRGRTESTLMTSALTSEELKERIRYHQCPTPPLEGSFRRSRSASALATYQLTSTGDGYDTLKPRRLLHSTSDLDDEGSSEWTFGESIIRTLSRRDIFLFNFENPQSQSDLAALEAWPNLKDKLRKLHFKSAPTVTESIAAGVEPSFPTAAGIEPSTGQETGRRGQAGEHHSKGGWV